MLKSTLAITVVALGLKDVKALWALVFIVSASMAAVIHLLLHRHIGFHRAFEDFAIIDVLGCFTYIIGVALF